MKYLLIVDAKTKALIENNHYCEYVESVCLDESFDCENCELYLEKTNEEV